MASDLSILRSLAGRWAGDFYSGTVGSWYIRWQDPSARAVQRIYHRRHWLSSAPWSFRCCFVVFIVYAVVVSAGWSMSGCITIRMVVMQRGLLVRGCLNTGIPGQQINGSAESQWDCTCPLISVTHQRVYLAVSAVIASEILSICNRLILFYDVCVDGWTPAPRLWLIQIWLGIDWCEIGPLQLEDSKWNHLKKGQFDCIDQIQWNDVQKRSSH